MLHVLVGAAGCLISLLTFFCGFGLGTLLMPVFALAMPAGSAVAATAIVHLVNSVAKLALVGGRARRDIVIRFGLPSLLAALFGAWVLGRLVQLSEPLASYPLLGRECRITVVNMVMGIIICGFALLELIPRIANARIDARWMPLGGALSGFFGGLSGHQGALRSAFLLRAGVSKDEFIGTGVAIGCLVDAARLAIYGLDRLIIPPGHGGMMMAACTGALAGSLIGARLIRSVTLMTVRWAAALGLMLLGAALAAGAIELLKPAG